MRRTLDPRVVPPEVDALIRAFQRRVPAHLAGGAALSGGWLAHRLSRDVDLFCHDPAQVRTLVRELPEIARECSAHFDIVQDSGTFVRTRARYAGGEIEIDLVHEAQADIEPPAEIDGIVVESLADLRAAKLTCLLSRREPRDLVDLLFLDRSGFPPENDLNLALRKDAGMDPAVLAWLLSNYPVRPLPAMLTPLDEPTLDRFRGDLQERFRRLAVPPRP